ncbi:peptidylprolyl isomerase [Neptunitalea chrysea]|uniref:Peptidylprolyl isomerase n=1 Tax=Neptunitalea chrysea TaxID=1647581 RepID=A0A9W6B7M1_9FLAO|nr:peptidylprolyl isomerase [Neptunitalea chrysea]GLB52228.1 peptidylprolyl isomerase [Neptunitalea chrysea]
MLNKVIALILCLGTFAGYSQGDDLAVNSEVKTDTVKRQRVKVDGVAAVVGDYIILDSDIQKTYQGLKAQGVSKSELSHCNLLGKLMEDKLYMHQAVQDSLDVSPTEIRSGVDRRIDYFLQQVDGDMTKLLDLYEMETEGELREELTTIIQEQLLTERMRDKIIEDIDVTPEEVRAFFYSIPEEERPNFGESVELAQIVIKPEIPKEETKKVVDKLRKMKEDIEDNGVRFSSKALLYSQDPGSKSRGGLYVGITRKTQFAKEFVDVSFSLQEGEVSEPFKTDFGWHIITVDKIRGEQRDVRHILLRPDVPTSSIRAAQEKIDSIRGALLNNEISFKDAAKKFSNEKETANSGGELINPQTYDKRFEMSKLDQDIYSNIYNLEEGDISQPIKEKDRSTGMEYFKIIKVTKKVPDHKADYAQDFTRIKELALTDKRIKEIKKWTEDKIKDTFINVSRDNRDCEFSSNWLKK